MILELNHDSVDQFRRLHPTEVDEGSYEEVQGIDFLHYFNRGEYGEQLGKMGFLCEKTFILETAAVDDIAWGGLTRVGDRITPTTGRIEMQLNHFGFSLKKKQELKRRLVRFVAEKMPRMVWDGTKALVEYKENEVVQLPLYHTQFTTFWTRPRTEERKERELEIFNDFRLWYFAPLLYCRACRRIHDGGHRWQVARMREHKTIWVRIKDRNSRKCPPAPSHRETA